MSDRPSLQVGTGPETIRVLKGALVDGILPHTYVSAGALVHMESVSGDLAAAAADEDSPLPVSASPLNPAALAGLLAEHAYVYRLRARKGDNGPELCEEESCPAAKSSRRSWPAKCGPRFPPCAG